MSGLADPSAAGGDHQGSGGQARRHVRHRGTDDWDRLMDVNLKSAWLMTRHAEPMMGEGSAIVTISSVGA
ncbi:SDR family oxidoreductase [Streptomyces sp. RM1]